RGDVRPRVLAVVRDVSLSRRARLQRTVLVQDRQRSRLRRRPPRAAADLVHQRRRAALLSRGLRQRRSRETGRPEHGRSVLVDRDITVWESLAICEYVADNYAPQLWPKDKAARALARSVSNEMHAGFAALRNACSMNLKADFRGSTLSPEAGADAYRVLTIWRMCREKFGAGGPWLFGNQFTIADAMYAP